MLKILTKRGLSIAPLQHRQINGCTGQATLDRWLDRALTVGSVDELLGRARRAGSRARSRAAG